MISLLKFDKEVTILLLNPVRIRTTEKNQDRFLHPGTKGFQMDTSDFTSSQLNSWR